MYDMPIVEHSISSAGIIRDTYEDGTIRIFNKSERKFKIKKQEESSFKELSSVPDSGIDMALKEIEYTFKPKHRNAIRK